MSETLRGDHQGETLRGTDPFLDLLALITFEGWAVGFNPGATPDCTIHRSVKCRREYVTAVGRGQSPDPLTALRTAWTRAQDAADLLESTATTPSAPAINLLDLLGLNKPAAPQITRRI